MLNIITHKIHDGEKLCAPCRRTKKSNLKEFENYEDVVNYFEGITDKGVPCGICMKSYEK